MKRSLDPKERLSCAICLVKFSSLESVFSKRLALSSARASLVMACQNKSICSHSWQREAGRNQTLQRKWKFHEISMDFWFHSSVSCVLVCIKNLQTFQTQHAPFAPPLLQSLWTTSPEQRNKTQLKWRQTAQSHVHVEHWDWNIIHTKTHKLHFVPPSSGLFLKDWQPKL